MKRRFIGFLLTLPIILVLVVAAPTCERGTVKGAGGPGYGEALNNLLAFIFIVGIPIALIGLTMLFGKKPAPKKEPEPLPPRRG
jgi:hypothetical protein